MEQSPELVCSSSHFWATQQQFYTMNVASKYAFHDPEVLKRVAAELQKQGRKFSTDPRLGEFADAKKCPGGRPSCTARSNAPCTICRFFSEGWSAVRE